MLLTAACGWTAACESGREESVDALSFSVDATADPVEQDGAIRDLIRRNRPRTAEDAVILRQLVNHAFGETVEPWSDEEARNAVPMLNRFAGGGHRAAVIGDTDDANDWPDCVAVGRPRDWWGSGTLVAPNVVLSAAHVATRPGTDRSITHVCLGPIVTRGRGLAIAIAGEPHLYPNPLGDPEFMPDLMVLILEEDVPASVALPRTFASSGALDDPDVGSVQVVGYGGNSPGSGTAGAGIRRKVDVPLQHRVCAPGDADEFKCHVDYEFVVGSRFINRGVCPGDSGGPAYVRLPGTGAWGLAGVTRRTVGEPSRPCGDFSVHVRLDTHDFIQWIRDVPGGRW